MEHVAYLGFPRCLRLANARVFLADDATSWRPAGPSESFCIWDLCVLWHEREAYVRTMLNGSSRA